jgi:prefoldin alpha subunit
MPQMDAEQKAKTLAEVRYLRQIYQSQYLVVSQAVNDKLEDLNNIDSAHRALEGMDEIQGKATLIPIGANVYMEGNVGKPKSVIISVGGGHFVEKSIDEAKQHVTKLMEKGTKDVNRLMKNKNELEAALIDLSYKEEELSH